MENLCKPRHPKSQEARKRRNKMQKERRKVLKQIKKDEEKLKVNEMEQKLMRMEKENALLKHTVRQTNKQRSKIHAVPLNYSVSILHSHRNKSYNIIQKFKTRFPKFLTTDLSLKNTEQLGCGVFGTVVPGYLNSIKQKVAVKLMSEKMTHENMLAEATVANELRGHPNFVFFFGIVEPNKLLFEFIGDDVTAPSLSDIFLRELQFNSYVSVCMDLVRALHFLHKKGFLHNDLHGRNILVRNMKHPKIIDFGKSTLMDDPVTYAIKPGTEKHKRYNTAHVHLAYELRNVPGSKVTCQSDVFSLGYNFGKIAGHVKCDKLTKVSFNMTSVMPRDRPELSSVLIQLSKLSS